jgi:hypothetical protein
MTPDSEAGAGWGTIRIKQRTFQRLKILQTLRAVKMNELSDEIVSKYIERSSEAPQIDAAMRSSRARKG